MHLTFIISQHVNKFDFKVIFLTMLYAEWYGWYGMGVPEHSGMVWYGVRVPEHTME